MIELSYPGKLYVLGEYAIMEPKNQAVLVAVNKKMTARIIQAERMTIKTAYGTFEDEQNGILNNKLRYVRSAYNVAVDYLKYLKKEAIPFSLEIVSELDGKENVKYGFGSSGCVIVAVIGAIMAHHQVDIDEIQLFKLATLAQYRMGEVSSGGDLAVAVSAGMVVYRRYDPSVLSDDITCVTKKWLNLEITQIPNSFHIEVGWSGEPHQTTSSLAQVSLMKKKEPEAYRVLIDEAQQIVQRFIDTNNLEEIQAYRHWLLRFEKWAQLVIETPRLTDLVNDALAAGYYAKSSGAGGGDCGIALAKVDNHRVLYKKWQQSKIEVVKKAVK